MKRTATIEQNICDACEKNEAYWFNACLNCGKTYCYECGKTHEIVYSHGVNTGGSGDGHYCLPCDAELRKTTDPLHAGYRAIRSLRDEQNGWYASFDQRRKAAEAHLEKLIQARKR